MPVLTITGLISGYLISGAVLVEYTFGLNGLGALLIQSVAREGLRGRPGDHAHLHRRVHPDQPRGRSPLRRRRSARAAPAEVSVTSASVTPEAVSARLPPALHPARGVPGAALVGGIVIGATRRRRHLRAAHRPRRSERDQARRHPGAPERGSPARAGLLRAGTSSRGSSTGRGSAFSAPSSSWRSRRSSACRSGCSRAIEGGLVDGVLARILGRRCSPSRRCCSPSSSSPRSGPGFWTATIAIAIIYVPLLARVVRGVVLVEREQGLRRRLQVQGFGGLARRGGAHAAERRPDDRRAVDAQLRLRAARPRRPRVPRARRPASDVRLGADARRRPQVHPPQLQRGDRGLRRDRCHRRRLQHRSATRSARGGRSR